MDKALKQRLVGASVLVALAVVVLPMLLGGRPESAQDARPIEIPPRPQELSFEKRRFPIGEQAPDQPTAVPDRPAPSLDEDHGGAGEIPEEGTAAAASPATLQERLEQVAAEKAESVSASVEANGGAPVATPTSPESDGEPDPPSVVADEASEPAGAPGNGAGVDAEGAAAPVVAAAPAGGRYLVQVASFSSTANANRLAGTLRDSGMPVVMDTVNGTAGVLHRVRVGPFGQRAAAEQVVSRLGRQIPDVRPRLVDLRPDDEGPVTEPDDPLVRWVVQVGVFSEASNAEQLVFQLRDAGFRASSQTERAGDSTVYKVRVGPELARADAVRLKDRIASERGIEGIVQSTD